MTMISPFFGVSVKPNAPVKVAAPHFQGNSPNPGNEGADSLNASPPRQRIKALRDAIAQESSNAKIAQLYDQLIPLVRTAHPEYLEVDLGRYAEFCRQNNLQQRLMAAVAELHEMDEAHTRRMRELPAYQDKRYELTRLLATGQFEPAEALGRKLANMADFSKEKPVVLEYVAGACFGQGKVDEAQNLLQEALALRCRAFREQYGEQEAQKLEGLLHAPAESTPAFTRKVLSEMENPSRYAPDDTHSLQVGITEIGHLLKSLSEIPQSPARNIQWLQARANLLARAQGWINDEPIAALDALAKYHIQEGKPQEALPIIRLSLALQYKWTNQYQQKFQEKAYPICQPDLVEFYIQQMKEKGKPVPSYVIALLKASYAMQVAGAAGQGESDVYDKLLALAETSKAFAEMPSNKAGEPERLARLAQECLQEANQYRYLIGRQKGIVRVNPNEDYI